MHIPAFEKVVAFHGHSCPGLALGFRVTEAAMRRLLVGRAVDEDLVAVIENNSCAVDAIQAMAGCTFGKGNLVFLDHGKQVYTFFRRSDGEGVRVAVGWKEPTEGEVDKAIWQRYMAGDRDSEVTATVNRCKKARTEAILQASEGGLLIFSEPQVEMPLPAKLHATLLCSACGEKVMASRAVQEGTTVRCIPCDRVKKSKMQN